MNVCVNREEPVNIRELISRTEYANMPGVDRTLSYYLLMSEAFWVGKADGEVACVWGLIPPTLMSNRAYLWLITTKLVDKHQFVFIRHSQLAIEIMLKEYDEIVGHTEVGNLRGIRWLKWLGAEFGKPEGRKVPFSIRKKDGPG